MDHDEWKNMTGAERKKILAEHKAELVKQKVANQTDTGTKESDDNEN